MEAPEECKELILRFRDEYAAANVRAVSQLAAKDWDSMWDVIIRRSAAELMEQDCDRFRVLRNLEGWADMYRRCICDPMKLFASSLDI
jgi:hypothetical protein